MTCRASALSDDGVRSGTSARKYQRAEVHGRNDEILVDVIEIIKRDDDDDEEEEGDRETNLGDFLSKEYLH